MHNRLLFLGLVLTTVIFVSGIFLPEWMHFEFLYPLVILLSIWTTGIRSTFDAGLVMTALIVTGYFLHGPTDTEKDMPARIVLPVACTWAFAYVIILYKKEQIKSAKINEHLRALFDNATEGMLISNRKGEIVMVNPHAGELFGYRPDELLNAKIETLIPERFAKNHVAHRQQYYSEMKTRPMGHGRVLYAKRKDGSEFPVEISLSHFRIHEESFVISFIIDITDRKKQDDLIARTPTSEFALLAALYYLRDHLDDHVDEVSEILENRRDAMIDAIREDMGPSVTTSRPDGGLYLWVGLPDGVDLGPALQAARQEGVSVLPGNNFSPSNEGKNYMRLCFGYETPEKIREGIDVLTNVLIDQGALSKN